MVFLAKAAQKAGGKLVLAENKGIAISLTAPKPIFDIQPTGYQGVVDDDKSLGFADVRVVRCIQS